MPDDRVVSFVFWTLSDVKCVLCGRSVNGAGIQAEVTIDERAKREYLCMKCTKEAIDKYTSLILGKRRKNVIADRD